MDAVETADTITGAVEEEKEQQRSEERFRRRTAILIGVLAMLLALTSLGGDNASTEVVNSNILASDTWAFYQAKNIRQTSYRLAADELEGQVLAQPGLSAELRGQLQERLAQYRATLDRLESEPETGEGKRELTEKARALEAQRERGLRQDPNFDYAGALFQIAIVLASVSIVALSRPLLWLGLALGGVACLLMLNGFFLFFELPIG